MTTYQEMQPLPAAPEAERAVIGCILQDNDLLTQAAEHLVADDFSVESHRRIYRTITKMAQMELPVDLNTLFRELMDRKELDAVGGATYISGLTDGVPRLDNISHYVRTVKEKSILRATVLAAEHIRTIAMDQSEESADVIASAQAAMQGLAERSVSASLETVADYLRRNYPQVDGFLTRNAREEGVPTGIREFDKITCGLQRGDLIIIAARPSMGKTAWAVNIAAHVSTKLRRTVAFFSLEMGKEQLIDRMVCGEANVNLQQQRAGMLSDLGQSYYRSALDVLLENQHLYIDDTPAQTLAQMEAKAMRLKANSGLDLLVVDYLQLIKGAGSNRQEEVSGISRGLKALAKRLGVPVVALCQLTREVAKRVDKRPMLQDLRESGAIEQDSDVVIFVHRPEYYEPNDESLQGKAELIVAKQRQGPLGTANVFYQAHCTRFMNDDPTKPGSIF